MIRTLAAAIAFALVAPAFAAEKFDEAKLIGSWSMTKSKELTEGTKATVTFGKDKSANAAFEIMGTKVEIKGTWKIDGDKLIFTRKEGDTEKVNFDTIVKLTDDVFITKDNKSGDETEFKKIKEEKK